MSFDITTFGEYAKIQGGFAYKSSDFSSNGFHPVLKIKNIRFGHIDYSETDYISQLVAEQTKDFSTKEGDILISMTGSGPNAPQSLVGRVARVWKGEPTAWINQRVGRIVLKNKQSIDPDFLFYFLTLKTSQDFLVANSSGSANQANINGKLIESLPCPMVDYKISSKIAKILRDIDNKITLNRQINQTLEAMAQALFKSWFVDFEPVKAKLSALAVGGSADDANLAAMSAISGKTTEQLLTLKTTHPDQFQQLYTTADLFPSEMVDSELGEIPKGWCFPNFDDLTIAKQGKYLSKEEQSEVLTNDFTVPVWGGNGVIGYSKKSTYSDPIVLMTCRGSNCGLIRFTTSESWVSNNSFACQAKVGGNFFLLQYFLNDDFSDCVSGSAQPQITYSALKTKRMRFPIETTVCCAYSFISNIFYEKIIQGINENNELTTVRDSLLPKLMAGELLVDGVGDE